LLLEARYTPGPTHPTTEEGTALHWGCERVLRSWLQHKAIELRSLIGEKCPENGVFITEIGRAHV